MNAPRIPRTGKTQKKIGDIGRTSVRDAISEIYKKNPGKTQEQYKGLAKDHLKAFVVQTQKNVRTLNELLAEINEQFLAINSALSSLKTYSLHDASLQNELNKLMVQLEDMKPLINNYLIGSNEAIADLQENNKVIKYNAQQIALIDGLLQNQKGIADKKQNIETIIRELMKRLANLGTGRMTLNGSNPVDWDDDPTVFENTSIGLGHILFFKQTWKNDGYSIGDVEGSIVLQPMQIKQVATLDWTRRDRARRTEIGEQEESITNTVTRESDSQEIVRTALGESIVGHSDSKSKSSGGSIGGSVAGPIGPAIFGISGGYQSSKQSASSNSSQNSSRNLAASAAQSLRDKIQQSASSVRSQRNIVIQEVSQSESGTVTTEVIANYNRRHAMTTMWFSINRHFVIEQEIADVQECLFFPMPMSPFDTNKIYRWRDVLLQNVLDRSHRAAFDSVERIVDEYKNINFPEARYCDEPIEYIHGEFMISFEIPRIPDPDERALEAALRENKAEDIQKAIDGIDVWVTNVWGQYHYLLHKTYRVPSDAYLANLKNVEKAKRDYTYEKNIVPVMVESIVDEHLRLYIEVDGRSVPIQADFTLVDKYEDHVNYRQNGTPGSSSFTSAKGRPLRVRFQCSEIEAKRIDIKKLKLGIAPLDDEFALPDGVRIMAHGARVQYSTEFGNYRLYGNSNLKDDLKCKKRENGTFAIDYAEMYVGKLTFAELQNPKQDDKMKAARLISHLNQHLERYHSIIWMNMDSSRLFRLMDGYVAPNSNGRSVASVVDSTPLGVIGNNLILKVVPGANLDPMYQVNNSQGITLLDHYKPDKPQEPFRVTVKNPGLYGESILGKCESAETIDDSKLWRYEDLKIPYLPSEIQPVGLESRYQNPGDLQIKDYAPPMINMQTLTPDSLKESTLKDAIALMGKGDSFRDATGLAGTQDLVKNAQNQNTQVLKNATDSANAAMQIGATYALEKQKQDLEAFKEVTKYATPEQRKAIVDEMMKDWKGNNASVQKAMQDANEIAKEQNKKAGEKSASGTLDKVKDFIGAGTKVDKLNIKDDGSVEMSGVTTNNESLKKWVTNNAETLLKIAEDYDLKQEGKENRDNVCWAYALALTLFPARNWDSSKDSESLITEMLGLIATEESETETDGTEDEEDLPESDTDMG